MITLPIALGMTRCLDFEFLVLSYLFHHIPVKTSALIFERNVKLKTPPFMSLVSCLFSFKKVASF